MAVEEVTVALDWTPNTNHVGLYAAQALGLYIQQGLKVTLLSPHSDNYKSTPAARVAAKQASFGLGPSETLFSYHSLPERPNLVAIAAVLEQNLSSIATLQESGISRPRDLDGKKYASYGARYEGRIVQKMIQSDGGKGEFWEVVPAKLGIWNTLLQGQADATWVFSGWEGCAASLAAIPLHEFKLAHYGIPYGYSPVLFLPSGHRQGLSGYGSEVCACNRERICMGSSPTEHPSGKYVSGTSGEGASGLAGGDCDSRAGSQVCGLHEECVPPRGWPLGTHGLCRLGGVSQVAAQGRLAYFLRSVTKPRSWNECHLG